MNTQSKSNDILTASPEDIKSVKFSYGAEAFYPVCDHPECYTVQEGKPLYKITFTRPLITKRCFSEYFSWTLCEKHLPPKIKNAPQIKLARFAARAKGRGNEK